MPYFLSPVGNNSQVSTSGAPLSSGTITTYQAGSSTPAATYTDNTGATPQANPITLNTYGLPPSPIWMLGGAALKFVIKDSLGNIIRTIDYVQGINDPLYTDDSNGLLFNGQITASVAGNALTIAVKTATGADPTASTPVTVGFRSATATTGQFTIRYITSALSITIAAGKTMGTTSAIPSRIWAGLIDFTTSTDDVRLAVMNARTATAVVAAYDHQIVSGVGLSSFGATAGTWFQSTNAIFTAKPLRIAGMVESTQATAGQWATTPSLVQTAYPGMKRPGDTVQITRSDSNTVATGTTVIPADDTIPQSTEGDQYLTITPTFVSAANRIEVKAQLHLATSAAAGTGLIAALFQGANTDASSAAMVNTPATAYINEVRIEAALLASAGALAVRAGGGSAGTVTFNGSAGVQRFGGVMNSFIEVKEIMA